MHIKINWYNRFIMGFLYEGYLEIDSMVEKIFVW